MYLKSTSTSTHHQIHSRRRRHLSIDVCGFLGVCTASTHHFFSSKYVLKLPLRVAEVTSAIVCGCLPVLPLLFRQHIPKLKSSLISTFRRMRQRTSDTSQLSKDSRPDTFDRALIKNNYVELYERSQSKDGMETAGKGAKQSSRSDTEITARRDWYEEQQRAIDKDIYT